MNVTTLGNCGIRSTRSGFVSDEERIPEIIRRQPGNSTENGLLFELAGPREWLFFDPKRSRAGIVTCGGLCPGLNNVVRSLFRELHDGYGVPEVLGFRMGYQGLDPARALEPFVLTHTMVDEIHKHGGTLLLRPFVTGTRVDHGAVGWLGSRLGLAFSSKFSARGCLRRRWDRRDPGDRHGARLDDSRRSRGWAARLLDHDYCAQPGRAFVGPDLGWCSLVAVRSRRYRLGHFCVCLGPAHLHRRQFHSSLAGKFRSRYASNCDLSRRAWWVPCIRISRSVYRPNIAWRVLPIAESSAWSSEILDVIACHSWAGRS